MDSKVCDRTSVIMCCISYCDSLCKYTEFIDNVCVNLSCLIRELLNELLKLKILIILLNFDLHFLD